MRRERQGQRGGKVKGEFAQYTQRRNNMIQMFVLNRYYCEDDML